MSQRRTKSFAVLNGDHDAGRPERTRHWHWNAGFLLGKGRSDRQTDRRDGPGLVEDGPPDVGTREREREKIEDCCPRGGPETPL